MAGFEPTTSCSQSRRDTGLRYTPSVFFEAANVVLFALHATLRLKLAERGGFEPPVPIAQYDSLANYWFQPLTHLSEKTTFNFSLSKLPKMAIFWDGKCMKIVCFQKI